MTGPLDVAAADAAGTAHGQIASAIADGVAVSAHKLVEEGARAQLLVLPGVVRIDDRVRPGVISMTHGWTATNPTALTSVVDDVDPLTGMICQSAIPVTLRRAHA